MPLEHECVHFSTQVLIRQASSGLILATQRQLQWSHLTQEGTLQREVMMALDKSVHRLNLGMLFFFLPVNPFVPMILRL